ncbi:MAG: SemiSWEET family transporter [Pseudomonadota bacterium]
MLAPTEWLGLIAGLVATCAALPQAIKIIRTRRADDISLTMFLMALLGAILWATYGWLESAPSIIFWNIFAIIQFSVIIILKLKHTKSASD